MSTVSVSTVEVAKAMSVTLQATAYKEIRTHIEQALRPYIEQWIKDVFKGAGVVKVDSYLDPTTLNTKYRFIVEMETNEDPFARDSLARRST